MNNLGIIETILRNQRQFFAEMEYKHTQHRQYLQPVEMVDTSGFFGWFTQKSLLLTSWRGKNPPPPDFKQVIQF